MINLKTRAPVHIDLLQIGPYLCALGHGTGRQLNTNRNTTTGTGNHPSPINTGRCNMQSRIASSAKIENSYGMIRLMPYHMAACKVLTASTDAQNGSADDVQLADRRREMDKLSRWPGPASVWTTAGDVGMVCGHVRGRV